MPKNIIDVSTWQENLDYKQLKASGVDGIIIRAGFSTTLDNEFYNHIKGTLEAGFEYIGAYWFGYAANTDEARAEANRADSILKEYKGFLNLGVYYDWEYDGEKKVKERGINPTRDLVTALNKTFCEVITAKGYYAGYYLNADYAYRLVNEQQLTAYRRWYAEWNGTDSCKEDCFLWQKTDKAHFNGYGGDLDLSWLMKDIPKPEEDPQDKPKKDRKDYKVTYRVYVEGLGWLPWVGDGETAGTQGQSKAIQAIQAEGGYGQNIMISYQLNVETNGDLAISSMGAVCGTIDLGRDAHAVRIWATGPELEIRAYLQKKGWTKWMPYGKWAGNPKDKLRVEAVQIRVKKNT